MTKLVDIQRMENTAHLFQSFTPEKIRKLIYFTIYYGIKKKTQISQCYKQETLKIIEMLTYSPNPDLYKITPYTSISCTVEVH